MKQETHGPHRSHEKPVKNKYHICSHLWLYLYIIYTLNWRGRIKHHLFDEWSLLVKPWVQFTLWCFVLAKFGWNWHNCFWEKVFYTYIMYFGSFVIIFTWKRAWSFIWTNLNHLPQEYFVPGLVEIGPMVLEKTNSKFHQCIFAISIIISTWERTWTFIWTNLNSLYLKMRCVQFSWNLPSGSWNKFL